MISFPFADDYYYPDIDQDLTHLDVINIKKDSIGEDLFRRSGIQIISKVIEKILGGVGYDYYLDYSYLISSYSSQRLDDYIFVSDQNDYLSREAIQKNYASLYEWLKVNRKGLYYHKNFFLYAKSPFILTSSSKGIDEDDSTFIPGCSVAADLKLTNIAAKSACIAKSQILNFNFENFVKESFNDQDKQGLNDQLFSLFSNHFTSREICSDKYLNLFSIPITGFPQSGGQQINGQGALFLFCISKEELQETQRDFLSKTLFNLTKDMAFSYVINSNFKLLEKYRTEALKSSIISILVDSYAHNISAHSMLALESWFRKRAELLERKIYKNNDSQKIEFNIREIPVPALNKISENAAQYYAILGLDDQSNTNQYLSLADIIRLKGFEGIENLFTGQSKLLDEVKGVIEVRNGRSAPPSESGELGIHQFPVPIDYALWQFFRFLKGKAAFWSGVSRDLPFGGERISLYDLLFKHLSDNPLYLGTIAHTEGINKLNIKIGIDKNFALANQETALKFYHFVQINTEVIQGDELTTIDKREQNNIASFELASGAAQQNSDTKIEYSKYGFVRLGKDFELLKNSLQNEYAFMPGGLVGIHSFLTIIENTIRNVKHYKHHFESGSGDDLKRNGLTLLITFNKVDLFNRQADEGTDLQRSKHRIYRVGVALGHAIAEPLYGLNNDIQKNLTIKLFEETFDNLTGKPKLGGTSQDKICSAMLFNNKFMSVETVNTARDYFYYPWIHPKQLLEKELMEGDISNCTFSDPIADSALRENENFDKQKKKQIVFNNLTSRPGNYLFKFFHIWASDELVKMGTDDRSDRFKKFENHSRFKFGIFPQGALEKYLSDIESGIQERDIFRIIESSDTEIDTSKAYQLWNSRIFKTNDEIKTVIYDLPAQPEISPIPIHGFSRTSIISQSRLNNFKLGKKINDLILPEGAMIFAHGNNPNIGKILNYRSHGALAEKFAIGGVIKSGVKAGVKYEFIETSFIKVKVWDDRIFEKMRNRNTEKYGSGLRLDFYPENNDHLNDFELVDQSLHTIFIIHLSFIEYLHRTLAADSPSHMIDWLIEHLINNEDLNFEKLTLTIISGRGNAEWYEGVNPKYLPFLLYRPVESLIDAIDDALVYGDDFQLKFNICKTIMGS